MSERYKTPLSHFMRLGVPQPDPRISWLTVKRVKLKIP